MSSIEDLSSLVPFAFRFGTTLEEMNDCFDNVGRILTIILESKLNDNFYDIMFRLKPIEDIDEYLSKFNFDREDSTELRAESESALQSVVKVEEFVKLLEKQEYDYKTIVTKTVQFIKSQDIDGHSDTPVSITSLSTSSPPVTKVSSKTKESQTVQTPEVKSQTSEVKSDFKLILKVNGEDMSYTIPKALEELKKTKQFYKKHFFATKCLRHCIEVLMALNEFNKTTISRWIYGDNAIKMKNTLWTKRQESKQSQSPNTIDNKSQPKNV